MTKTPEEIMKGLECCLLYDEEDCVNCPYIADHKCGMKMGKDVYAYVQKLESRVSTLTAKEVMYDTLLEAAARMQKERDAAIAAARLNGTK